jgi:hypothetical protein
MRLDAQICASDVGFVITPPAIVYTIRATPNASARKFMWITWCNSWVPRRRVSNHRLAAHTLAALLVSPATIAAQAAFWQHVKQIPFGFETGASANAGHSGADASAMVAVSEMVVRGIVGQSSSRIASGGRSVETIYHVQVDEVLFSRYPDSSTPIASLSVVKVKHVGGTVTMDGHTIRVADSPLSQITLGTRCVLYLQKDAADDTYVIRDSPLSGNDDQISSFVKTEIGMQTLFQSSASALAKILHELPTKASRALAMRNDRSPELPLNS